MRIDKVLREEKTVKCQICKQFITVVGFGVIAYHPKCWEKHLTDQENKHLERS